MINNLKSFLKSRSISRNNLFVLILFLTVFVFRLITLTPAYKSGDYVRVSGPVITDPHIYGNSQMIKVGTLTSYLPRFPLVHYGDYIILEGQLDQRNLLKPRIIQLTSGNSVAIKLRNRIIEYYQTNLPEPEAGILAGIVLGSKGSLDNDFYESSKNSGIAHIVVASGTNISFITIFLFSTVSLFLSRNRSIPFVILGCVLYLFLSGFDAPLVRASIMSGALIFGNYTGRLTNTWRLFFLTAGLMLIYNPIWVYDVGFLLSFSATAGLILFSNPLNKRLIFVPTWFRENLVTSISAGTAVAPILLIAFGKINILAPLANVLILWSVAPLMILGVIGGFVGLVWREAGVILLWLAYPLLTWIEYISEIFGG